MQPDSADRMTVAVLLVRVDIAVVERCQSVTAVNDHLHIPDVDLTATSRFRCSVAFAPRTAGATPGTGHGNVRVVQDGVIATEVDSNEDRRNLSLICRNDQEQIQRRCAIGAILQRECCPCSLAIKQSVI